MDASRKHNSAIYPLMKLIVEHAPTEADQWVLLETLCLGVGKLNGRTPRDTAVFVETIAERLTEGARS